MAAKKCLICNCAFAGRADAKTCSPRCRKRLQQLRFSLAHEAPQANKTGGWRKSATMVVLGLFGLLSIFFAFQAPRIAYAATADTTLNFQGRLLTAGGAVVPDGSYNIDFKLYDASSSSGSTPGSCTGDADCVWDEVHTNFASQGVTVTNGYFSVTLGAITSFSSSINWNQQLWLTMDVTTNGTQVTNPITADWNGEMLNTGSRIPLSQVPSAFEANALGNVIGGNEQSLQFAGSYTQATTITLPDPGAGTATICYQNASACGFAPTTGGSGYVQLQGSTPGTAQTGNFNISGGGSGTGIATNFYAGNFDVATSNSALNIGTSSAGVITIGNTTNSTFTFKAKSSTTAYQLQNSSGANLLSIDSTGGLTSADLIANPSFETTISGSGAGIWVIKQGGAGTPTISNNTSFSYNQLNSAKVVTTANANDGIKQQLNSTLSTGTSYNVSFYVLLDSSSAPMTNDLVAGYSSTGASDDTTCAKSISVYTSGWTRYNCTFVTPGSTSSGNYFFIKQTDAAVHTFYVDSVLMQPTASSDANYRDSQVSVNGMVTSPLTIQNASNTSNSFQVQTSSGDQLINVDTTNSNLISNGGFDVNTAGWAGKTAGGVISRITTSPTPVEGYGALQVVVNPGVSTGGAKFNVTLVSGGSYSLCAEIAASGAQYSQFRYGYSFDGSTETGTTTTTATISTGWTQYCLNFSPSSISGTPYIFFMDTNSTAHTFFLDNVYLINNQPVKDPFYKDGSLSLNGVVTSPLLLQNQADSDTAFQVQNAVGNLVLLDVDTTNGRIGIGKLPVNGMLDVGGTVNTSGTFSTNNVDRIDASGNLLSIGNFTAAGGSTFATTGTTGFTFKPGSDNSNAFQLQNANGSSTLLVADTSHFTLTLGSASSTPVVLILGNKNTSGDPATCSTGGIYYNSNSGLFRACQNGSWGSLSVGDLTTFVPAPIGMDGTTGGASYATNTTAYFSMFTLSNPITISQISLIPSAVTATGSVVAGIYNSSGSSLITSTTITVGAGATVKTSTLGTAVVLPAGTYYLAWVTTGTTNVSLVQYDLLDAQNNTPTSGAVMEGTTTVTAGTLPSTITPSSLTFSMAGASAAANFRFN